MTWKEMALYCLDIYGVQVDWEEEFFICPECGEPILKEDWTDDELENCPICEYPWLETIGTSL